MIWMLVGLGVWLYLVGGVTIGIRTMLGTEVDPSPAWCTILCIVGVIVWPGLVAIAVLLALGDWVNDRLHP